MKTIVTGGSGMVGKSLKEIMPNAVYLSSKDYDLTSENEVIKMYYEIKPDVVIHLAAIVGGIIDNINRPAIYFTKNVLMNTLLVEHAYKNNIKSISYNLISYTENFNFSKINNLAVKQSSGDLLLFLNREVH